MQVELSPAVLCGARQGRVWPQMWVKQSIARDRAAPEAFLACGALLGMPSMAQVRPYQIQPLREFVQRRGWIVAELGEGGLAFTNRAPLVIGAGNHRTLESTTRARYLACIENARVRGRSVLVEVEGRVLLDYEPGEWSLMSDQLELDAAVFRHSERDTWIIDPPADSELVIEEAFALTGPNTFAFGHWLAENLPRLAMALMSGSMPSLPILIDKGMPVQHRQALEAMLPDGHDIIEIAPGQPVRCRRLWCASDLFYCPVLPSPGQPIRPDWMSAPPREFAEVMAYMRERMMRGIEPAHCGRLYVARKAESHRKLVNHVEVEAVARDHGYHIFFPEKLAFRDQLALIADAEEIVGPEGSGLFLAFLATPGTRICILNHPYTESLATVTALMEEIGLDCVVVTGPCVRQDEHYVHFSDYRIEPAQLEEVLKCWPAQGRACD